MRRRGIIGAIAAILAIAGVLLLINYANGADARAIANQKPTNVLVVVRDVPIGTAAKALTPYVETKQLPQAAVVSGAVTDVAQLPQDNVASTTLKAGEQVLSTRFVSPNSDDLTAQVALPEGLQQLSIQLEPQRVVGAKLRAGDTVGIFISMKVDSAEGSSAVAMTHAIAHKVLVLRSQGAQQQTVAPGAATAADAKAPSTDVIVTLAVDAATAERIVFGQEFGKIYLSQEKEESKTDGTKIVNAGNVYQP